MSNISTYSPLMYWKILNTTAVSSEGVYELLDLQSVLQNINTERIGKTLIKDIRMLAAIIDTENIYGVLDFINNKILYSDKQELMHDILYSTDITPSVDEFKLFIQDIGKGYKAREAADRRNIPLRTAYKYDNRFGFTQKYKDKLLDTAYEAIEDKLTIQEYADKNDMTYYKAQSLMSAAKKVQHELEGATSDQ